MPKEMAGDTEN